jgi:hypothetical protein
MASLHPFHISKKLIGPSFIVWASLIVCSYNRLYFGQKCTFKKPDSSVGIKTGYGLDGQGSIPGRGKIFLLSTASRLAVGRIIPPIQWVPGVVSRACKAAGA